MSKKDYIILAECVTAAVSQINNVYNAPNVSGDCLLSAQDGVRTLAIQIANRLAGENPRFNRDTFLKACGL